MNVPTARGALALFSALLAPVATPVAGASDPGPGEAPVQIPLDEIEPGARAWARTVLSGTEISTFDLEIVSVVRGIGPARDIVLAKAIGEELEHLGVAQGMSGSPVFVGDRLVGALAFTWPFLKEPFLGITPAAQMAREAELGTGRARKASSHGGRPGGPSGRAPGGALHGAPEGIPDGAPDVPGGAPSFGLARALEFRDPSASGTGTRPEGSRADSRGLAPIGTPLILSGFDARVVDLAADLFEPWGFTVVAGGAAGQGQEGGAIEPGATIGVRLAGGDANMTAIGTVTWVDDDRVHAWGHPFFQIGEVDMPLVSGYIHAVIPSQMISFKLGSGAEIVGTATGDRGSGIFGTLGSGPPLTDFELTVLQEGEPTSFHFELVRNRFLTPSLVGLTATNAILVRGGAVADETVRFRQRLVLADGRETTVETMMAGDRNLQTVAKLLSDATKAIVTNPFEDVVLDRIEAEISFEPGIRAGVLSEISLEDDRPEPGDVVRGSYIVQDYRGAQSRHRFRVPIPEDAREGRYLLLVGSAAAAEKYESERDPRSFRPRDLGEYLERLGTLRRPDDVHLHLYRSSSGVQIDGRPLADLPPSVVSVMAGATRAGKDRDLPAELVWEERVPAGRFLRGGLTVLFEVRKEKP